MIVPKTLPVLTGSFQVNKSQWQSFLASGAVVVGTVGVDIVIVE